MRIGFYHDDLPTPGRKPGGVPVLVHRLAQELSARGHELTFWTRGPAPANANYRHVRLWPRLRSDSKPLRTFAVPLLQNTVDWRNVEVLHLHGDDWLLFRRPVPTVRTLYGSALLEARYATSLRRRSWQTMIAGLEYLSARLATSCYGLGPGVPGVYPTLGNLDGGIEFPPDVRLEREGPPSILFVGTWQGRKRGSLLHRVFSDHVLLNVPSAELWMVSDRCEPAPGVRWLAAPDDEQLMSLYQRAWVMCLPSTYEGLGLPYLEAMAGGTPVLSSVNPGARHVLGPELAASSLVDDADLGQALVKLLTDEPVRRRQAEQGRQRVQAFSWDAVVEQHLDAYRMAIERFAS